MQVRFYYNFKNPHKVFITFILAFYLFVEPGNGTRWFWHQKNSFIKHIIYLYSKDINGCPIVISKETARFSYTFLYLIYNDLIIKVNIFEECIFANFVCVYSLNAFTRLFIHEQSAMQSGWIQAFNRTRFGFDKTRLWSSLCFFAFL